MDEDPPQKRLKFDQEPILVPILSDELTQPIPTVRAWAGIIKDPKVISKLILQLNTKLPIHELQHLKRVKGRKILICKLDTTKNPLELLQSVKIDSIDDFETVEVAAQPPVTKMQHQQIQTLWPCNFHANKYLEKLITNSLFSDAELNFHKKIMKLTLEIANLARCQSATLVIDPNLNSIVAFGISQAEKCPIRHSVMVAIDNVAKTQNGGQWDAIPLEATIQSAIKAHHPEIEWNWVKSTDDGPYLCTNYAIYTTFEPCITCAMGLVHSRAKRVFYGSKSKMGGLGSLCKIHSISALNHHYEVFAGLLQSECEQLMTLF